MSAPATLVPFDIADTLAVSTALFERIVEATNETGLKNKWFRESDKRDVIRAILKPERGPPNRSLKTSRR